MNAILTKGQQPDHGGIGPQVLCQARDVETEREQGRARAKSQIEKRQHQLGIDHPLGNSRADTGGKQQPEVAGPDLFFGR
ncbi:MAG: hypothetical protein AAGF79_06465 [Pseudomonadota bacterium]